MGRRGKDKAREEARERAEASLGPEATADSATSAASTDIRRNCPKQEMCWTCGKTGHLQAKCWQG